MIAQLAPPPLPAELQGLAEITPPDPVSWMPRTAGWAVLAASLLAGLSWWAWRRYRRWRADAYRRAALAELRRLGGSLRDRGERPRALQELAALLKRTALAAFPRQRVAELSGEPWLRFLDDTMPSASRGPVFRDGPGRALGSGPYEKASEVDAAPLEVVEGLLGACETWIRRHRSEVPEG